MDRVKQFLRANEMYSGELLPANQSETWFFQKGKYYENLFLKTVEELEQYFLREKDVAGRLELYARAAAIYPFENWQVKQIRGNLEIYRYEEALNIYQQTMELYAKELGSEPPAELYECFEQMELAEENHKNYVKNAYGWKNMDKVFLGKREDLQRALFHEKDRKGAYCCTYPSFVDYCHLMVRSKARNKVDAVLMFLTLTQKEERVQQGHMNLQEEMEKLKEVIGDSLRIGDAYTRYGSRHFILMLSGTTVDFCGIIFQRIEKAYARRSAGGKLWYYADMTQELEQE